jgi:hypothetical protein
VDWTAAIRLGSAQSSLSVDGVLDCLFYFVVCSLVSEKLRADCSVSSIVKILTLKVLYYLADVRHAGGD